MNQWYDELLEAFDAEIGLIGGGYFEAGAITVTTYSSAFRFMERMGNRWGLLIFDECHHLPSQVYRYAAELAIAPFRLGLTATPERADAGERFLTQLIGPTLYRREANTSLVNTCASTALSCHRDALVGRPGGCCWGTSTL
jgi:superfamily II DNA or RNA helicase